MKTLDGTRSEHQIGSWRPDHRPVFEVASGETFLVRVPDSSSGQLNAKSTSEDLRRLDYSRVDAGVGPIAVRGAKPGMTLEVDLLSIRVGTWGWSGIFRGFGFLKQRFDDELVTWKLDHRFAAPVSGFLRPVRIPLDPMLGVLGVAPETGEFPMIPPQHFGGNMDSRLHRAGTTVVLPVYQPEALFALGDPHASQGDGEVCGTGIETPAEVRLRLRVVPEAAPPRPRARLAHLPERRGPFLVATGIDPDLTEATRQATLDLMDQLVGRGLSEKEAYLLLSVTGDLRISEVVDDPNRVVSMVFPLSVLPRRPPDHVQRGRPSRALIR